MSIIQQNTGSGRSAALLERRRNHSFRRLRTVVPLNETELVIDGKKLVNLSSNDYLGLSKHPFLKERAIEFVQKFGVGAGASRLISGNNQVYEDLEARLAQLKHTESALIFPTGFQLNVSVLEALKYDTDFIYLDRWCHNSLLLGAKLNSHRFSRFNHNDLGDLAIKLRSSSSKPSNKSKWVVTESVFGMDGDLAPLSELTKLQNEENFQLFVDEAHATGVFGKQGMGLTDENASVTLKMGTFSKGCGSFGAYVAASAEMRDFLINFCPGLIYTTALPPAVLGAIDAALTLIPDMHAEREYLRNAGQYLKEGCSELGLDTGNSQSQIVPIILGDEDKTDALAVYLQEQGFFVPSIKPPTVPLGSARVRVSLSAAISSNILDSFLERLRRWREQAN